VLIAGPTASGKSALALELAQKAGGIVINTDSMQVYRDLRIITARPTPEEEARVPHRLYGHVDASVNFSAGAWVTDAAKVLAEVRAERRLPIFIGGSGLYFKALTRGLSAVPPIPAEVRDGLTGVWAPKGKIGSIGVHVSRGVTTHGFAVNVDNDLQPFEWVVPCGIEGAQMSSVCKETGESGRLPHFREAIIARFCEVFEREAQVVVSTAG